MPAKVVVGVQWGDEGKGKIIDILSSRADVVVRSQGGNNAGHTVESGGEIYKLRLIPSGILYEKTYCAIGCGVVLDPASILEEINELKQRNVSFDRFFIDPRVHVVMPWHLLLDDASEKFRGKYNIGTTKRGIGPCYMDKSERSGIRMFDLINPEIFRSKAKIVGNFKNNLLTQVYGEKPLDIERIICEYIEYGKQLKPFVKDVSVKVYEEYCKGKEILFEGAQGTLLDLDVGTYPFVTSSNPISGGVCTGTGIGPTMIDEVIGVAKAYSTRVGQGPFPTEIFGQTSGFIRKRGDEFGTNTGRARRVGWFDSVIARHAVRTNGLTSLAINKLDTLSGIEKLKVCSSYQTKDGKIIYDFPCSFEELEDLTPVYEELLGFEDDIGQCRNYSNLPKACQKYISRLENLCKCRINMIGVGPARSQNIER